LALAVLCSTTAASAQDSNLFAPAPAPQARPDSTAVKSSQKPVFTIPVEPLGFSSPGPIYLGQFFSLASLDFLDEDQLLFTFRVPGLIHREHTAGNEVSEEHYFRALVLELPDGAVQAETVWTLHNRARYLWMLKDGHFLLRDGNDLQQGDATLALKPLLRFPGPLLSVELDPTQQFLVTNSREPQATPKPGEVLSPATAAATVTEDGKSASAPSDLVVRILHRDSGQVMLVSHVRSQVHLPINSDGYLNSQRADEAQWLLNLNYFTGGSATLAKLNSTCSPSFDFVSQREVLVLACNTLGDRKLVAMSTDGRRLWEKITSDKQVWPRLVMGPDGSRLAREALSVSHTINASSPFSREDVKGQIVEVIDAANGQVALTAQANPVLDAGGNVAISPSGRRVAILNAGAIQIYELPTPPPLPAIKSSQSAR
jgi:hypothetical protein